MLYDPKWEAKQKQKPSLTGLIAWLETQNPRGTYDFANCRGECLIGQYMAYLGIPWGASPVSMIGPGNAWTKTAYWKVCAAIFPALNFSALSESPWTYGGALRRMREISRS
jgi:hypothetical protein